jgi:hypothetical protein
VEMVELDIAMGDDLVTRVRGFAVQYFGDDGDESLARVLELAFAMRRLWSHSVKDGQHEVNEAISNWEFPESAVTEGNRATINDWLFRR